jgi:hypothetical protein
MSKFMSLYYLMYTLSHPLFLHASTIIRDEVGLSLDKIGSEVLGIGSKVILT